MTYQKRVRAFEDAMLNTVVRAVHEAFSGLTLSNCMESEEFRVVMRLALDQPLFTAKYEKASLAARSNLIEIIDHHSY